MDLYSVLAAVAGCEVDLSSCSCPLERCLKKKPQSPIHDDVREGEGGGPQGPGRLSHVLHSDPLQHALRWAQGTGAVLGSGKRSVSPVWYRKPSS